MRFLHFSMNKFLKFVQFFVSKSIIHSFNHLYFRYIAPKLDFRAKIEICAIIALVKFKKFVCARGEQRLHNTTRNTNIQEVLVSFEAVMVVTE